MAIIRIYRKMFLTLIIVVNCILVYKLNYTKHFIKIPPNRLNLTQPDDSLTFTYHSDFCDCDRLFVPKASSDNQTLHWCSEESTLRGMNQNVVAYSLFGSARRRGNNTNYFVLLKKIPKQVKHYYSDWRMRIYHNIRKKQTLEHHILCDTYCRNDHVDLCSIQEMIHSFAKVKKRTGKPVPVDHHSLRDLNMRMWRYLAMLDPQVDRFMARDTDSEINERESDAVNQWLESPYTFHVVRDHQGHFAEIMGGIFGVKVHQRRDLVQGLTKAMISHGIRSDDKSLDQNLLASIFWPTVKDDAMIHDSHHCTRDWNSLPATPFRTQRINLTFVTDRVGADWGRPIKCPIECRPPEHQDWEYC